MAARPPVKLNGVTLPPQMIAAEAQHHPARTPAAAFDLAARALIVRTLLLEDAARRGIHATPELVAEGKRETQDEALIRVLLEKNVPVRLPGEQECRECYSANTAWFRSPDLFEASHILFAAAPGNAEAYADADAKARAAIEDLSRRPELFEIIARERSDCASKSHGGRLGQIVRGETVPEFEVALSTLAEGTICRQPIKTGFGVHVLRLDARIEGKPLPFEYVRERIEAFLAEREWRRNTARFIDDLVGKAVIEGVDMAPEARVA